MFNRLRRTNSLDWLDRKAMISEALELALEEIDREAYRGLTSSHKNTQMDQKSEQQQQQQQQKVEEVRGGEEIEVAAMPNKTDEEKQLQRGEMGNELTMKANMGVDESGAAAGAGAVEKEPIYENISSAISMHEVDNEMPAASVEITERRLRRRSIPNNNSNSNNNDTHNQIINQNNNSNNNNSNNNNSNSNIVNSSDNNNITPTTPTTTRTTSSSSLTLTLDDTIGSNDAEPYYQVPKALEPYYDAPKHLRPIPVYENIEIFYTGMEAATLASGNGNGSGSGSSVMEPPKEKPPPPPTESPPPVPLPPHHGSDDEHAEDSSSVWSTDNTYETIVGSARRHLGEVVQQPQPSPPIKRMNSTKRIKKEMRNKRSSFLGIDTTGDLDDVDGYLELTVAPPPDMAQLLQEERRLEKQLYIKAGLCDSSDTGESRDSGVSENHSRQSSEHYTNSSEENDTQPDTPPPPPLPSLPPSSHIYQNETPLLQTAKGNSAESWTESATAAAAATQSLSEATATANAKMLSIEEKIREQGEVLRVERELLHFSQEELKRQRENLLLRENLARRELQHGAKMLMSNNRRSLQDLHHGMAIGNGMLSAFQPPPPPSQALQAQPQTAMLQRQHPHHQMGHHPQQHQQQIYANVPHHQQQLQLQQQQQPQSQPHQQYYQQVETDYRKSMSDLNEFSKRLMLPPTPPTKPLRAMHISTTNGLEPEYAMARQRHSLTAQGAIYTGSLVKIAGAPLAAPRPPATVTANYTVGNLYHHQSAQNLNQQSGNMSRNTLLALSATPKPKYTDGWVQVQQRKNYDSNLANDPAWLSAYQQKRKSMPDYGQAAAHNNGTNHWLVQEAEQRRLLEQQQQQQQQQQSHNRRSMPSTNGGSNSNGKPLPDSIIQTLTERVQSKGIGERKRFENGTYSQVNGNGFAHHQQPQQTQQLKHAISNNNNNNSSSSSSNTNNNINGSNGNINKSNPHIINGNNSNSNNNNSQQEKVLSVSGKKKCSHCGDELGRGAAMIIESLLLFYHINCFKCCVCHVQLGDGLNGTDVRVRNHKLHCQNCYSSDDGIKFSCV